ncbi:M28 family peptidase [Terrimonas sp. NA20]|uniref:M28 family peptidase n=1 Tax=Terrimonas ginsenosidimutans TaxID=2908004 RepID=A0ABS9KKU1_9BACT|nr:M28 family peptidase [Terrimonas ginsenosidimutans]MCG2612919.1 M28 family peptidase [Terrimonas ginsenosidimutans]
MTRLLTLFLAGSLTLPALSQNNADNYFKLNRTGFNQKNAYTTTGYVEQRWRVPGNTGFNESIYYVEKILKNAGFVLQKENEQEAPMTYRLETRPLKQDTWEPIDASATIEGESTPLIAFKTNRNMIPINCPSTNGNVTAEVVYINKSEISKIGTMDLKGKILFSETSAGSLLNQAAKAGVIGVMGYNLPAYTQPEKHQTSIQFGSIPSKSTAWAILLSYAAKEKLKAACQKGKTMVNVNIQTKSYPSTELTLVANVRGSVKPDERFVYSAHVQEPGANDNASGVGCLAEMARLYASLIKTKKFSPQRTMTFLWGTEISATQRYIVEDSVRAKGILWGMSLDMVGEDTKKTGGSFLIEKMPDPSAIWTRGEDKHTEWGAGDVKEENLFPHYFNDFILDICNQQGRFAKWTVNANPFEGGSDHTPFLRNKIPGLLMWHFTDVFYHTDNDRLDKVSATTLKNVGVSALTAGMTLVNADENTALAIAKTVAAAANTRMNAEFLLSQKAVKDGKDLTQEKHILETWRNWYVTALTTIGDLPVKKETTRVGSNLKFLVLDLEKTTGDMLEKLGK